MHVCAYARDNRATRQHKKNILNPQRPQAHLVLDVLAGLRLEHDRIAELTVDAALVARLIDFLGELRFLGHGAAGSAAAAAGGCRRRRRSLAIWNVWASCCCCPAVRVGVRPMGEFQRNLLAQIEFRD